MLCHPHHKQVPVHICVDLPMLQFLDLFTSVMNMIIMYLSHNVSLTLILLSKPFYILRCAFSTFPVTIHWPESRQVSIWMLDNKVERDTVEKMSAIAVVGVQQMMMAHCDVTGSDTRSTSLRWIVTSWPSLLVAGPQSLSLSLACA